ncbi:frequency clock protein [Leptodontidium sp. 2 PMI_412]|nr:frequency clock protein [Leptodontidium sp. 2 PMI_412]
MEDAADAQVGTDGRPALAAAARQSSDESYDSGESADGWFDRANKRVGRGLGFLGMEDDEPPYFLPHNSNNSNDASMDRSILQTRQSTSQPQRFQHSVSGGSSIGDYRSVIDDLTIENRKLKQELRKLKKSNETQLQEDKLFELKIHATLSARKRKELEDVLGSFALSIDVPSEKTTTKSQDSEITNSYSALDHTKKSAAKHSSPSNTSTSRIPDSAYASMSNSGPTSLFTPTNRHGIEGRKPSQPAVKTDQNIHSFLHNIPEGLLPKHSPVITERQKKKLVVQRLEELFTGRKGLIVGAHSQPLQQQEVSASAAKADEAANNGVSPIEGHREAHMLPNITDVDSSKPKDFAGPSGNKIPADAYGSDASDEPSPSDSTPSQRPTRPLDLDPDRAQIPSENVDYIRHLGLSTPKFNSETSSDSSAAADADGWIYLNLLVSMAQLHIINVTPDFVREALSAVSERFQVSQDGKKVRWRGGTQGTRMSSDDGTSTAANQTPDNSDNLDEHNRKRRKVDARKFAPVPVDAPDAETNHNKPIQSFHYKPLFHHAESSGGFISSDESESLFDYNARKGDGPRSASADPRIWRSGLDQKSAKEKQDAGLLVYYSGAKFCTDLSGDRDRASTALQVSAADEDDCSNGQQGALGDTSQKDAPPFERTPSGSMLPFRPFKDYSKGASILGLGVPRPTTPDLLSGQTGEDFLFVASASSTAPPNHRQAFDSTGLGGTRPADHFIMNVETRRTIRDGYQPNSFSRFSPSDSMQKEFLHTIPRSSLDSFFEPALQTKVASAAKPAKTSVLESLPVRTEILSSQLRHLEPSELPPPLGYHTACSSSDEDSDSSDCSSQSLRLQHKKSYPQLSYASSRLFEHPPWAQRYPDGGLSDGDESDDCDDDDDGEGSIDMLAEARGLDPETVAAKEKEFEMCIDDKGTDAATINESVPPSFRGAFRRSTISDVPTSSPSLDAEEDDD